jgi:PPOX class probable F420-dependent enzyme
VSAHQTKSIDRKTVIPESHADLLRSTVDVVLTTVSPAGYPQSTLVWCSYDGGHVLLNTGIGYRKERNMRKNHRVSVFAYDQQNHLRWIEVQGDVVLIEEGAVEHLNKLSLEYTGKGDFYKEVMPELAGKEVRVIVRVTPTKIRVGNGKDVQSAGVKSG